MEEVLDPKKMQLRKSLTAPLAQKGKEERKGKKRKKKGKESAPSEPGRRG